MARLTRVPVKKILHGIDPKESPRSQPTTDGNANLEPESVLQKKIPNTVHVQMPSTQHLHLKNSEPTLPGDVHPYLNLPRAKEIHNKRYSMPPIFDNLGGALKDGTLCNGGGRSHSLFPSRVHSRNNLNDVDSQPILTNVKKTEEEADTDQATRTMLETQGQICKDVSEMVRYIQEQERGELMKEEWQLIAAIIDKFFLWLFLFILAISTVVIFLQAPSYAWE